MKWYQEKNKGTGNFTKLARTDVPSALVVSRMSITKRKIIETLTTQSEKQHKNVDDEAKKQKSALLL